MPKIIPSLIIHFKSFKKWGAQAGITTRDFPLKLKKTTDLDLPAKQKQFSKLIQKENCAYLHQVHEAKVAVIDSKKYFQKKGFHRFSKTDGAITNIPGLTLLCMTADCLSIFLAAPGWVGVVHAGWRGTQKKIVEIAVKRLLQKSGCKASQIHVFFGPSICGKHYEVGEEFKKYFLPPALTYQKGKYTLDLVKENKTQLRGCRIPSKNIFQCSYCTISNGRLFYSFRKEKDSAGRMVSFITLN